MSMTSPTTSAALPAIPHRVYAKRIREEIGSQEFGRRYPGVSTKIFQPVPMRLLAVPINILLIAAGYVIITSGLGGLIGKLLAALLIGNAFASLGFLGHEVMHNAVVRTPWFKNLLGGVCFSPFWLGPLLWRVWHNEMHHNHTQHPEDDPDTSPSYEKLEQSRLLRVVFRFVRPERLLLVPMLAIRFTLHSHMMLWKVQKVWTGRKRFTLWAQWAIAFFSWNCLIFVVGFPTFFWSYLLPLLIGNFIVVGYIATNHLLNPQLIDRDELQASLSVRVPWLFDVWHLGFAHHVPHHLFPAMSHKWGPLLGDIVGKLWPERYHQMPILQAWRLLWKTPRLYFNYDRLIDPNNRRIFPTLGRGLTPDSV